MTSSDRAEWESQEGEELALGPLASISPSRFFAAKECPLREALSVNRIAPALASRPAARLGSAIHRLLEHAGRGEFAPGNAEAIDRKWEQLVADTERLMSSSWLERHMVPLKGSVPDFEVRRIQARQRALELAETAITARARGLRADSCYGCELSVSSPDGKVRGQIDAVLLTDQGPVVRDYKSGAIFEPRTEGPGILKPAYQTQLRLYAALYALTAGEWPVRLEIVPVLGDAQEVEFDRESCLALIGEARQLLHEVNAVLASGRSWDEIRSALARPSPSTCLSCAYRPICRPYRVTADAGEPGTTFGDLWGEFVNLQELGNGRLLIEVRTHGQIIRIRGLGPRDRHPALQNLTPRERVGIFNLRATGSQTTFGESPFTVVYRVRV